jgi:hypothetical protein
MVVAAGGSGLRREGQLPSVLASVASVEPPAD